MRIEIQGQDAIEVTRKILAIEEIQGHYETVSEVEKEGILATIATIIGITTGTMAIAEKLYEINQKKQNTAESAKIERVLIFGKNGDRLLLKDASIEQLKKLLDEEKK